MNVPVVPMRRSQRLRHRNQLLHRVIDILNNPRAEKQTLNVISFIKLDGEVNYFLNAEPRTRRIAGHPIHAILTIVNAEIRQKNFQKRYAPAIRGVTVANTNLVRIPQLRAIVCSLRPAGSA